MHPKIANAQRRISFALSKDHLASLYGDIESAGVIQYHHLLVIYGPDKQPCLFFGSEWSGLDPSYKFEPVLGVFSEIGHSNFGGSVDWFDDALFVLGAFKFARGMLHIEDSGMTEGEAWAMVEILKKIQRPSNDAALMRHRTGYEQALRCNDGRMVDYIKAVERKDTLG